MEAVRIIKEMRDATNGKYPTFALWENVPGAFSSNKGEDFRIVLEELIKIVEPCAAMPDVPKKGWAYADSYRGDGWSLAYRVFDAQYWGVPQRRRRIHLVLDLRGECAQQVLFEREGVRGYFAESGAERQTAPGYAENCIGVADREGERNGITYALDQQGGKGSANFAEEVMPTLCSDSHGTPHAVAYPFRPVAVDGYNQTISEKPGSLRAGKSDDDHVGIVVHPVPNILLEDQGGQQISVRTDGKSPTLRAEMHGNVPCVMVRPVTYDARGNGDGNTCNTITGDHEDRITDYTSVVVAQDVVYSIGNGQVDQLGMSDVARTLDCMHDQQAIMIKKSPRYIVRRLTPTECARLQGFPDRWGHFPEKDDFTDEEYCFWLDVRNTHAEINGKAVKEYTKEQMVKWYNKLHTDSAEYKMWGNGIALPPAIYCMQGMVEVLNERKNKNEQS